ncbi:PIN/TRAM domain-containing protein [Lactococcus lactis]|uniref:PIN/TRAM domain-containing protein n=4 Tax=Bacillati TaxID=1783272 RepID=A0A6M0M7X9_9LACT|nr:PIN/TRAM domain-containing protein [Lactococcus lactis]NEX49736.1 PIN/TRAM domain-containing protein [Lactococcus lactis]NEX55566.1 PIN/TRAM domain-containing protein [Lactococcus lactis]
MRRWIIHLVMTVIGASLGVAVVPSILKVFGWDTGILQNEAVDGVIGAIIFIILSFIFAGSMLNGLKKIDSRISKMNMSKMVFNIIGIVLGLLVGVIGSIPLRFLNVPILSNIISFILVLVMIYLGYVLFDRRGDEIARVLFRKRREAMATEPAEVAEEVVSESKSNNSILLDTSSIIDGRILDVIKTGFISDKIIVPNFVILELQLISDSSDPLKRAKGRRGLDLVNELTKFDQVEISQVDFPDVREVDTKLLKYASSTGSKLVTNDFNLNKVAEIQGVQVLNINDLANAVKTQLVVGEHINVQIIRAGSERQQGVAYLPDGTMIVIEDTAKLIDKTVTVEVAKVLQTSAGRMIFADLVKNKEENR